MIVDFPIHMLRPEDPSVAFDYMTRPDQDATNGMGRTIALTGARLKVTLAAIPVYGLDLARQFRQQLALIEGRTNLVRFRLPDVYGLDGHFALPTKGLREAWSIGLPVESGGAYHAPGDDASRPTLKGTIASAAALNSRMLYLGQTPPAGIVGSFVSIEEFCYTVRGFWPGDSNRISISPVLRRAIAASTIIEYAPRFVGRLVTGSPGYEAMSKGRIGRHTLEFVEDTTRARAPYVVE